MLQAYLTIGPVFTPTSAERVLSAILTPQLALGCASVAFGLAACEAEDFKHRNILRVSVHVMSCPILNRLDVSHLSPVAAGVLRLAQLPSPSCISSGGNCIKDTGVDVHGRHRASHCWVVVSVSLRYRCPRWDTSTVSAHPGRHVLGFEIHSVLAGALDFVGLCIQSSLTRLRPQTLILYFVYWDFRISRTSTLVPAAWSTGARLIDYFITLGYLHNVGLLPTAEHATLVFLCTIVNHGSVVCSACCSCRSGFLSQLPPLH